MGMNLLLVIAFPEGEPYLDANVDAEMLADVIVNDMNEDRRRNCDEAGRPDYYKPVMVHAIPAPQWVDGEGLAVLVRAIQLVSAAQKPLLPPEPVSPTTPDISEIKVL